MHDEPMAPGPALSAFEEARQYYGPALENPSLPLLLEAQAAFAAVPPHERIYLLAHLQYLALKGAMESQMLLGMVHQTLEQLTGAVSNLCDQVLLAAHAGPIPGLGWPDAQQPMQPWPAAYPGSGPLEARPSHPAGPSHQAPGGQAPGGALTFEALEAQANARPAYGDGEKAASSIPAAAQEDGHEA